MDTKDYIMKGADELFCQYGFRSVTMDDIARHLGVSKKTIYQHYTDKNDLVNSLLRDRIVSQDFQMKKRLLESDNAVQELYFATEDLDFLLATMNPMLFFDLQKYHPKAWRSFMVFKEKEIGKKVRENLQRGIAEGFYRSDLNVDIISRMRIDHMDIIFAENRNYNTFNYTLIEIMIEITRHFLFGICNNEGQKLIHKYDKEILKITNKDNN